MKKQIAGIFCLLAGVLSVNLFSAPDVAAHPYAHDAAASVQFDTGLHPGFTREQCESEDVPAHGHLLLNAEPSFSKPMGHYWRESEHELIRGCRHLVSAFPHYPDPNLGLPPEPVEPPAPQCPANRPNPVELSGRVVCKADCPENAHRLSSGFCECDEGYQTPDGGVVESSSCKKFTKAECDADPNRYWDPDHPNLGPCVRRVRYFPPECHFNECELRDGEWVPTTAQPQPIDLDPPIEPNTPVEPVLVHNELTRTPEDVQSGPEAVQNAAAQLGIAAVAFGPAGTCDPITEYDTGFDCVPRVVCESDQVENRWFNRCETCTAPAIPNLAGNGCECPPNEYPYYDEELNEWGCSVNPPATLFGSGNAPDPYAPGGEYCESTGNPDCGQVNTGGSNLDCGENEVFENGICVQPAEGDRLTRTPEDVQSGPEAVQNAAAQLGIAQASYAPVQQISPSDESRLPEYAAPAALLGALAFSSLYPDYELGSSFNYSGENGNLDWEAGMRGDFHHGSFRSYVSATQSDSGFEIESGTTYRSDSFLASYTTVEAKDYMNYAVQLSAPWQHRGWEIKPNLSSEFHYDRNENHSSSESGAGLDLEYRF